jgi:hypothetical protein
VTTQNKIYINIKMNSQKYNKDELYPDDFTEDDKLEFDLLLEQSKMLFPKLSNDDWLIKKGILAYMRKNKMGDIEPPSQEEIASIRNQYTKDTVFYTEPIEIQE